MLHPAYDRVMPVALIIPPLFTIGLGMLLAGFFGPAYPLRWWILRLGLIPMLCFGAAAYIVVYPTPIPTNYDPNVHGNPGRSDFAAMLVWGFAFPSAYLLVAVPVSLAYAIWRRRKF
jgi:hypothetical protein